MLEWLTDSPAFPDVMRGLVRILNQLGLTDATSSD